jgi:RNA polymerase sigma-70 factor (ECF subfamily)
MATTSTQHDPHRSLHRPGIADDGPDPTDEELMCRVCSDDGVAAFESLMHRHEHDILRYLRRYLGTVEMAEDACQATFLRVHQKRHSFTAGRRFRPWLYAIATNLAVDACRHARRHRMVGLDQAVGGADDGAQLVDFLAGDEQTADVRVDREELRRWVAAAIRQLPESMQTPVVLVYHQGMKYREAAHTLGIPVGTVKSRLHAALARIGRSWQQSGLNN